jgi:PhnB protein
MQTRLNPYLSFKDNAREAMEFYRAVFGGELHMITFGESHASQDPSEDSRIMHSMLEADPLITFMASDTPKGMEYRPGTNVRMSLSGDNEGELRGYWDKLSAGAPCMCHWRRRLGATLLACSPISSELGGS